MKSINQIKSTSVALAFLVATISRAFAYGADYPQYCAIIFESYITPAINGCVGKITSVGTPNWKSASGAANTCGSGKRRELERMFELNKKRDEFSKIPQILTINRLGMTFPFSIEAVHPVTGEPLAKIVETDLDNSGNQSLDTGVQISFDVFSKKSLSYTGDFGTINFKTACNRMRQSAVQIATAGEFPNNSATVEKIDRNEADAATSTKLAEERRKREALERKLAALEEEKQTRQQTIAADTQKPTITASASSNGTDGIISGTVRDNVEVAEVLVGGQVVALNADGSFKTSLYVPRSGKTVEIVVVDAKGNKATKSLFLERGAVQGATGPVFASLNPSGKRVRANKDALALIIGVADYERTSAKAAYADKDAKTFYDYALLKLGIPAGNIKELVNVDANRIDVSLAIKDWIARTTKQGSSDIYVFFAGHGLASQSGEQMYLLPYDGSPRLLEDSAISRERLFADISAANPRSVTVFLDTCYSVTTRGTDMLIASRPIAIKALKQSVPDNFTVMTAARGDQTANPLEEAKHGMFSYFLMKGMEGDADANKDNQITAGELHQYVQQNVVQQSSGRQTPELQGDANKVLVRFQ